MGESSSRVTSPNADIPFKGRIDDIKMRRLPDGVAPQGRMAFIAFMTDNDCFEVMRRVKLGTQFPKTMTDLNERKHMLTITALKTMSLYYLTVEKAVPGRWCTKARKIVEVKAVKDLYRTYASGRKFRIASDLVGLDYNSLLTFLLAYIQHWRLYRDISPLNSEPEEAFLNIPILTRRLQLPHLAMLRACPVHR